MSSARLLMRQEYDDTSHLLPSNLVRLLHWQRLAVIFGSVFIVMIMYQQFTVPVLDLDLYPDKYHRPAVCNTSNEKWMAVLSSQDHTDYCQKCEALKQLDHLCGERSDICQLCEASKSSIFFIEFTNSTTFTSRQACTIESAAKHHPDKDVTVYVTTEKNCTRNQITQAVCSMSNVKLITIDTNTAISKVGLSDLAQGQPLSKLKTKSSNHTDYMNDALKLAMIYDKGGMYLDLDTMILKPLSDLSFGLAHDGHVIPDVLEIGVMKLPPKSTYVSNVLKAINESYVENGELIESGSAVMTKVFREKCPDFINFNETEKNCMGMVLYPPSSFFPVTQPEHKKFFEPDQADVVKEATKSSYGANYWNKDTFVLPILSGSRQGISVLASANCPNVFPKLTNFKSKKLLPL